MALVVGLIPCVVRLLSSVVRLVTLVVHLVALSSSRLSSSVQLPLVLRLVHLVPRPPASVSQVGQSHRRIDHKCFSTRNVVAKGLKPHPHHSLQDGNVYTICTSFSSPP